MSAIPKDAADIPTAFPHPTGAATVINSNGVDSNFTFTTNLTNFAFAPSAFSSASASWSSPSPSPSSSSSSSAPASTSPSRLESRASPLPPPRDFTVEQHQAEYRGQAYFANESTVATIQAAGTYLQKIFTNGTDVNKDILRAASAASRARLQNPFAYNNSRSSSSSSGSSSSTGSSGSSGSSRQSAKQAEHDAAEAAIARDRFEVFGFPDPELDKIPSPIPPYKLDHSLAPYRPGISKIDLAFLDHLNKQREAACPENIRAAEEAKRAAKSTAPRGTAIPGGVPCDPTTSATKTSKTPPKDAAIHTSASTTNPAANIASDPADPTDDSPAVLAKIGPGSTCPAAAIAAAAQADPLAPPATPAAPAAPTEADFLALEEKLTKISGRPFTIGRSAKIHDPAVVAYFEDHALYIQNQISMARFREACINADSRSRWPHGP